MNLSNKLPTAERVRSLLDYDPTTGEFRWRNGGRRKAGYVLFGSGYIRISIDGAHFRAHRLAWLWVHGCWPEHDIDHINGVRADNRISNLRDVTRSVNLQNQRRPRSTNTSGFLGAYKSGARWMALIEAGGKQRYLGTFDTPDRAHAAYVAAKRQLHEGNTL